MNWLRNWARSKSLWSRRLSGRSLDSRRPQTVTLEYNRLELLLNDFIDTRSKQGEALGWLGLVVGLGAALVSADFSYEETRLGLTGTQWQTLFVAAAVLAVLGLLRSGWSVASGPSIHDFLVAVWSDTGAKLEERAIFLVKRDRPGEGKVLLVYKSPTWGCDLLPNANLSESSDISSLPGVLAAQLGIAPEGVSLSEFEGAGFISRKHSVFYGRESTYDFRFFLASLTEPLPDEALSEVFTVRGRQFSWKSLAEMQGDPEAARKNGDVLKYLSERSQSLLLDPPDSVP